MTTLIIDDEADACSTLKHFLRLYCPQAQVLGTASGVAEGLQLLELHPQADILFLDIRMGDGTGFDLLERADRLPPTLIFTTAYDEYAVKAFKYGAADYLLKPIDPLELQEALSRVSKNHRPEQVQAIAETYRRRNFERLVIPTVDEFVFVEIADLLRCEADSNYTILYLTKGKKIVAPRTLKDFEALLAQEGFFRVHQSHLVNLRYVQQFQHHDNLLIMSDGSCVEVSRRKKADFLEFIRMKKL